MYQACESDRLSISLYESDDRQVQVHAFRHLTDNAPVVIYNDDHEESVSQDLVPSMGVLFDVDSLIKYLSPEVGFDIGVFFPRREYMRFLGQVIEQEFLNLGKVLRQIEDRQKAVEASAHGERPYAEWTGWLN
ncbi:MAG: hypothetical protein HQK59_17770 [Deltaproteobacteria bacterium]|nr:hypothetical protein [Deltaproteobacteria bacterium]